MARLRNLRVALTIGVVSIATSLLADDLRIREPVIDGKTVADWAIALKSPDAAVRRTAVDKLREFQPWSEAALPSLLEALADPDREVREKLFPAVLACQGRILKHRELTESVVKAAERLLHDRDAQARTMATRLLYLITDSRLLDDLIGLLDDPDAQVRAAGATSLRQCVIDTQKRFRRVFAAWERLDRTARPAIPETPGNPERPDAAQEPAANDQTLAKTKDALDAVIRGSRFGSAAAIEATRSPKAHVRLDAIVLCQNMQLDAGQLQTILRRALKDADAHVRCHALTFVNHFEKNDADAWSILWKALDDPDARIRETAAAAIRNCRASDPRTVPELMTRTHHFDVLVRAAAIDRLGHFATDLERVALPLLPLFDDPDPDIRVEMARLAGHALAGGSATARSVVLGRLVRTLMTDDDESVSNAACDAIAAAESVDRQDRLNCLLRALQFSEHGFVRAVRQLPDFEPDGARTIPILVDRFGRRRDIYGFYMSMMLLRFGDAGEKAFLRTLDELDPEQIADHANWLEFFTKSAPVQRAAAFRGLAAAKSAGRGKAILALLGENGTRRGWNSVAPTPMDLSEVPPAAMRSIVEALGDSDADNRRNVCRVLKLIPPTPLVIRSLLQAAQDKDGAVRLAAIEALRRHRVFPAAVVECLFESAKDPGPAGECALQTLAEIDVDVSRLAAALEGRIAHGGWTLEWKTASFARLPHERIARTLADRLEKENAAPESSFAMGRLLEATKTIAIPANALLPALTKSACHWNCYIRFAAIERLGAFGPSAKSALSLVGARCADEVEFVANAARSALDKIDR